MSGLAGPEQYHASLRRTRARYTVPPATMLVCRDSAHRQFDFMTDLRLLVLSVGTRVGQNVLTTLNGRRDGLLLMGTSSVANEPALFDFDVAYRVPPTAADL